MELIVSTVITAGTLLAGHFGALMKNRFVHPRGMAVQQLDQIG